MAVKDLMSIDNYTIEKWGLRQAERYLRQIESFCNHLADHPRTGRVLTPKRPQILRAEHREHVIFYRIVPDSIFISRILHSRMLPERQRIP
jgi:toxin ParE1/3/4